MHTFIRGACCITVIIVRNRMCSNPGEDCVHSLCANAHGKGINPSVLHPDMGK